MRCNKCGSQVYNGEWYCGECGTKIDYSNGSMQDNNYNYSYKVKSKTKKAIIIVLSVIVGIIVVLGIIGLLTSDEDTNKAITQNNYINNSTAIEPTNTNKTNSNTNNYNTNTSTNSNANNYTPSATNTTENNYNNNASNSGATNNNYNNNNGTTNNNQKAYTRYYLQYNGQEYSNIYIELTGSNIYLYDKDLELYFAGTFTVNNNFITGAYKQVKYNNGGDIMTIDCNDEFEFQILSTNQLQDKLGYYSYVDGQTMHRNAVYYKE